MEQTENRTRSAIYEEIYKIVKQIPTKDVYGDAMDAPSASVLLEQLFKKWQQHGVSGSASGAVDKTVSEGLCDYFEGQKCDCKIGEYCKGKL